MKIRHIDLDDQTLNPEHSALGLPPVEYEVTHALDHPIIRVLGYCVFGLLGSLVLYLAYQLFYGSPNQDGWHIIQTTLHSSTFWSAFSVGLLAQIIDGALGMAYGITATSFLIASGAPPVLASGATHLAEVFTTGVSGVSHLRLGNVNKKLFFSLLIPGVIGALLGTYVLTSIDGKIIKPYVSIYLLLMGVYVLTKAFRHIKPSNEIRTKKIVPLALFGGLMDTTGGGGWGPIVTTSLVGSGHNPRTTIGTVNFAEFFLTTTVAAAFFTLLDHQVWILVAGLSLGGLLAAPFSALIAKKLKPKILLIMVGLLISLISAFNLYQSFFS